MQTSHEDRLAIEAQIYNYAYTFDSGDVEGWLDVFTDDGVWEAFLYGQDEPLTRLTTREEFRSFAQTVGVPVAGKVLHHTSGIVFDDLEADRARTRSMVLLTRQELRGPLVATHGIYEDEWCKTADGWRIAHRRYIAAGYHPGPRATSGEKAE